MTLDRTSAAALAEAGLTAVVGPGIVAGLREDSPLARIGLTSADLICLSDAIANAATTAGAHCVLDDADMVDLVTVADLVSAVAACGEQGARP